MIGQDRDDRILAHVGLYHVTFRRIVARLFFNGSEKACQNVVDRLVAQDRLSAVNLGGSPLQYLMLSAPEARRRSLPQRGKPPGGRALAEAIGVLWFCTILAQRYRLEREELCRVLGPDAPHGEHCAEPGDRPRIYRIYVPGPWTKPSAIVATVDELLSAARDHPALSSWVANQLYGVAVLVPTEARAKPIQEAIDSKRLGEGARIIIERAPDAQALPGALYALKRNASHTAGP